MNSPQVDQPGSLLPASPAERCLVLGHSQPWLQAARQLLQADTQPMRAWRWAAGLVQVVDAAGLGAALQALLRDGTRQLTVVHEPGWPQDIHRALDQALPRLGARMQVQVCDDRPPFDQLRALLRQPDGEPTLRWLRGGRRRWPRLDSPGMAPDDVRAAEAAFRGWAEAYEASHPANDLDDSYGQADQVFDAPQREQLMPTTATQPHRPEAGNFSSPRLAPYAAAAASGPAPHWSMSGVLDEQASEGAQDGYALTAGPMTSPDHRAVHTLQVQLTLSAKAWQGHRRLVLELHAPRQAPLLLHLGDAPLAHQPQDPPRFNRDQACEVSQAFLLAFGKGGEVRLVSLPPVGGGARHK